MTQLDDGLSPAIIQLREKELTDEIRSVLKVIANWMAMPLFLIFWGADLLYVPQFKWEFLGIRVLILPLCIGVTWLSRRIESPKKLSRLAVAYSISIASGINLMIFMISDPTTLYYAGLYLVLIGGASFIPFSRKQFSFAVAGIYLPYYCIVLPIAKNSNDYKGIAINSFFILSSIGICFLIRFFHEGIRLKEIEARKQLHEEITNREEIIQVKTSEGVHLASLSRQFSPQIVESIKSGKLELEGSGNRCEICTIFIDIVNSTDRVVRIDKEQVEKVLTRFLDDTIKILLKYDITIDKFLGDGILAFCNAPLPRKDFAHRVVQACLELRLKIKEDEAFYQKYWQQPFEIRAGIAKGYANVGFYGSKKYFQTYTAIGPVMNLAARLCSSAEPNQILIDWNVQESISEEFEMTFIGKRTLKGFESEVIQVYEIKDLKEKSQFKAGINECATCGGILSLETNEKGQFVFLCRSCCSIIGATDPSSKAS